MEQLRPVRVIIADDHPVVRSGLHMAIRQDPSLEVVGEVNDGAAAIQQIAELQPDIAILDINMPKVNGLAVARQIRQQNLNVKIIMLTAHDGEDLFRTAMDAGANGYLLKDSALLEITTAIRMVFEGKPYVSSSITEYLVHRSSSKAGPKLDPVEQRILRLIVAAESSKDIARQLGLSVRTIENRRSVICDKLGVTGAHALLKWALEHKAEFA